MENRPPQPKNLEESGLDLRFLADLTLKVIYTGAITIGDELAATLKLPYQKIIEEVLRFLKDEKLCEIKGGTTYFPFSWRYELTERGRARAAEALKDNSYVGPAPVALSDYSSVVKKDKLRETPVSKDALIDAFSRLVLDPRIIDLLGPAVNSSKSIFLYGPPGNGKTCIAEGMAKCFTTYTLVPYAITVDNQIIKLFDPSYHFEVEVNEEKSSKRYDKRWIMIKRPIVEVGGELTLKELDLIYEEKARFYESPFQLKANGGMLLIDDFGRQRVAPRDLLNRWIVPLEKRIDYLTLHTGKKIEVPFSPFIVYATNLDPKDLVDEAFLRRISYKIGINDPSEEEYGEIFRRVCLAKGIEHAGETVNYLVEKYYRDEKRAFRACHPRDLVDHIIDQAAYRGVEPKLDRASLDYAAGSYFVTV
ncbi:MAG: ATP-binding protein [bacterium]|nr:ATP-binding protein [bacterium]